MLIRSAMYRPLAVNFSEAYPPSPVTSTSPPGAPFFRKIVQRPSRRDWARYLKVHSGCEKLASVSFASPSAKELLHCICVTENESERTVKRAAKSDTNGTYRCAAT